MTIYQCSLSCSKNDNESYLLGVVLLVRQHRGDVEHDLDASPIRVDRIQASQVVNGVQATLVFVEALQPNFLAEDLQEFLEQRRVVVVVEDLLLGALAFSDVNHPDFQLRLYEHLIQFEQLVLGVWQLTQYQRWVHVHLFTEAANHFLAIVPTRDD